VDDAEGSGSYSLCAEQAYMLASIFIVLATIRPFDSTVFPESALTLGESEFVESPPPTPSALLVQGSGSNWDI
jgi:hypothetical protein